MVRLCEKVPDRNKILRTLGKMFKVFLRQCALYNVFCLHIMLRPSREIVKYSRVGLLFYFILPN